MPEDKERDVQNVSKNYWRIGYIGIITGIVCITTGVVITILRFNGSITMIFETPGGFKSSLINAGPGVLLIVVGMILLLKYKPMIKIIRTSGREVTEVTFLSVIWIVLAIIILCLSNNALFERVAFIKILK